jgi:hypothetical protein
MTTRGDPRNEKLYLDVPFPEKDPSEGSWCAMGPRCTVLVRAQRP